MEIDFGQLIVIIFKHYFKNYYEDKGEINFNGKLFRKVLLLFKEILRFLLRHNCLFFLFVYTLIRNKPVTIVTVYCYNTSSLDNDSICM